MFKKLVASTVVTGSVALACAVAAPAASAIADCRAGREEKGGREGASAFCEFGGKQGDRFRIVVTCRILSSGNKYKVYGPWRWYGGGVWSEAYCERNEKMVTYEVEYDEVKTVRTPAQV